MNSQVVFLESLFLLVSAAVAAFALSHKSQVSDKAMSYLLCAIASFAIAASFLGGSQIVGYETSAPLMLSLIHI